MASKHRLSKEEININKEIMLRKFKSACESICPNEKELCNIIIDICYSSPSLRQFAWDICNETIIDNLLHKNNYIIHYPVLVPSNGEFEFGGEQFIMKTKKVEEAEKIL